MSITYSFSWEKSVDESQRYELLKLNYFGKESLNINLLDSSLEIVENLKKKCGEIKLHSGKDIKLDAFISTNYDINALNAKLNNNEIEEIKLNIKQLYKLIEVSVESDSKDTFKIATNYYLDNYLNKDTNKGEAQKYKTLALFRHSLRKYLVLSSISIVIYENLVCEYKGVEEGDKKKQIDLLRGLLYDSTKLLLNIDAVPSFETSKLVSEKSDDDLNFTLNPPT